MADDVFTPAEVAKLWQHQFGPWSDYFRPEPGKPPRMHPFTCDNRGDGRHIEVGGDIGVLIPTVRGWICPCCDYTQNWAHGFMKAGR